MDNYCSLYKEAKEKILVAWLEFRIDINDYLPKGDLKYYKNFSDAYVYYDELDENDILIIQKRYKAFVDLVNSTIMHNHVGGGLTRGYSKLEKVAKDKNLDEVLRVSWDLFKELRTTIIILEKLYFENGRMLMRKPFI